MAGGRGTRRAQHPPVLLLQSVDDDFVTTDASRYYFRIMRAHAVPALKIVDPGMVHGIVVSETAPAAVRYAARPLPARAARGAAR